jgi:hypothetical protein
MQILPQAGQTTYFILSSSEKRLFKEDKTAVYIGISMPTSHFTNSFCPP